MVPGTNGIGRHDMGGCGRASTGTWRRRRRWGFDKEMSKFREVSHEEMYRNRVRGYFKQSW